MDDLFSEFFKKNSKTFRYRKGEFIIRPDFPPSGIFYIEKGFVRVYFLTGDGEEKLYIIYKEDEIFPMLWAVVDEQKHLFYEAMGEVVLRRVSKEDFLNFIQQDTDVLIEFIKRLATVFTVFTDRVHNLEISKAYPRVVARLLLLSKRFGVKEGTSVKIVVPIKHKDIASSIGLTRETTSRELEKIEKKDFIATEKQYLVIKNVKKLEAELELYGEED